MKFVTHPSTDPVWCFAKVPGLSYYMRTHVCVAHVPCSYCKAVVNEPCKSPDDDTYHVGTHFYRRNAYQVYKKLNATKSQPNETQGN